MIPGYMKTLNDAVRRLEDREKAKEQSDTTPLISLNSYFVTPTGDFEAAPESQNQGNNPETNPPISSRHGDDEIRNKRNKPPEESNTSAETPATIFAALERQCPKHVDLVRWQQAVEDGRRFLAEWGSQAIALGWTGEELFGLHTPPSNPHSSYNRMARYDATGLIWLLTGNPVVAMTEATAAIQHKSGSITTYRKLNKPGLGPLGDSLDDFR